VTPVQLGEVLANSHLWTFDVIRLEELTEKRFDIKNVNFVII
jgi:hypothetical protein